MSRILRWVIPVDDALHTIPCGPIIHVDCRASDSVTFWASDQEPRLRALQLFATGQEIPEGWEWRGTGLSPERDPGPRGTLVWHLFEQVAS